METKILLDVQNLKKYYKIRTKTGKKSVQRAVDGVSFQISCGETLGLVGESGCGKTTLGRTVLRLLEPDGGLISYDGVDITHASMRPYRSRMQIIFQNPAGCLDPRSRIGDIVAEGLRANRICGSATERHERVLSLLESVGIDQNSVSRYPHEFSGGQQQRIGIARALAVEPEFIVCDEPISSLDVSYQSQIINLLEDMQSRLGLTYLFISHDLSVVRHISDRIGVMFLGKLVELGTSNQVVTDPAHQYTKALLDAIPRPDPVISRSKDAAVTDEVTDLSFPESGCRYCNLCKYAEKKCFEAEPELREIAPGHLCACFLYQ